jgi:predicted RNA-binding protein with PIN domain
MLGWHADDHADGPRRLINHLHSTLAMSGDRLIICFDGVEPLGHVQSSGEVRTSGSREADDLILEAISEKADDEDVCVISGDYSLRTGAMTRGARIPDALAWMGEVGLGTPDHQHAAPARYEQDSPMPTLHDRLDPDVAAKLERLRRNID